MDVQISRVVSFFFALFFCLFLGFAYAQEGADKKAEALEKAPPQSAGKQAENEKPIDQKSAEPKSEEALVESKTPDPVQTKTPIEVPAPSPDPVELKALDPSKEEAKKTAPDQNKEEALVENPEEAPEEIPEEIPDETGDTPEKLTEELTEEPSSISSGEPEAPGSPDFLSKEGAKKLFLPPYIYDSTNKKNPFAKPGILAEEELIIDPGDRLHPVENESLDVIQLRAILLGKENVIPRALFETSDGRAYTLTKHDRIGDEGAIIYRIEEDRVHVMKPFFDPNTGNKAFNPDSIALKNDRSSSAKNFWYER